MRHPRNQGPIVGALSRALTAGQRQAITLDVRGWLGFQATLTRWQRQRTSLDAIPFVGLYARGHLRGCMGCREGGPNERLARAFLSAVADVRFGGVRAADREVLVAEVNFLRAPRACTPAEIAAEFEPGTHGICLVRDSGPVFLLPSVARDGGLDAQGMLAALYRKAGGATGSLVLFGVETVVVRRGRSVATPLSPMDAAARWLAALVAVDGTMTFARDARSGESTHRGKMRHGRAASAIQALDAHGGHSRVVQRARQWLLGEVRAGLRGDPVDDWPAHPAEVAGTLALTLRAGVDLFAETLAHAEANERVLAGVPWHAAQVVAALGSHAPASLSAACVQDLERRPWAPWTVLALDARGENTSAARAVSTLVLSVRREPPHQGAVVAARLPEVALTALTVEALRTRRGDPGVRAAVRRAEGFLAGNQLLGGRIPASFTTTGTIGAFLATPTASLLRGDVTAHAMLALGGRTNARPRVPRPRA